MESIKSLVNVLLGTLGQYVKQTLMTVLEIRVKITRLVLMNSIGSHAIVLLDSLVQCVK